MKKAGRIIRWVDQKREILLALVFLGIYSVLIFERLPEFPIYFFCDEAVLGVEANALLTTGADQFGVPWPVFFRGFGDYQQSLAIYLQIPFNLLFGMNEFSIRLMTSCISLIGIAAVYALLRVIYKMESAWLTCAVFALSPVWFLHSRSGFEVTIAVSFFLVFALFYLLTLSRHWLFGIPAAVCGAATLYAYTPGRGWMVLALLLLGIVNLPEHIKHWKRIVPGILILTLLFSPYAYFQWKYPERAMSRLTALNFGGLANQSLTQQVWQILKNYLKGLHPAYWYTWEGTLHTGPMGERHVIPPLPQLLVWTFPFAILGLLMILWRIRKVENRTILVLFLISPIPASLVGFNNVRGMPVGIFLLVFSLIGAGWLFRFLQRWPRVPKILHLLLAGALIFHTITFRTHVYNVAPLSHHDYGFYGVQMGAPQIFEWIQQHHTDYTRIILADNLFNAGYIFTRFYLAKEVASKISIDNPEKKFCTSRTSPPEDEAYILRVSFHDRLKRTGCPLEMQVIEKIPDARGKPLFEILQIRRAENFQEWFQHVEVERRQLQTDTVRINDQDFQIEHPVFDIGTPDVLVDGDPKTLARSEGINPARIRVHLPSATIHQVDVTVSHNARVDLNVASWSENVRIDWGSKQGEMSGATPEIFQFRHESGIAGVTVLEIVIKALDADRYGHVHINEIAWE